MDVKLIRYTNANQNSSKLKLRTAWSTTSMVERMKLVGDEPKLLPRRVMKQRTLPSVPAASRVGHMIDLNNMCEFDNVQFRNSVSHNGGIVLESLETSA